MLCPGDTQLTSCWLDMTHNKQGVVWIWHTINKMLVWIWHTINKMLFGYDTQLTICCVEIIHN